MPDVLDNPIWHALHSGNATIALGCETARYTRRDIGFFAGLSSNSTNEFDALHTQLPDHALAVLFTPEAVTIPANWQIDLQKPLSQMVYNEDQLPVETDTEPVALNDSHIPAMLELTALTKPGPFLSRTIDFGNYEGFFEDGQLVSMAGQRLQPDPYTEVSAVCTHPQHTGKGYAARLITSQIGKILRAGRIPFLHVYPENTTAIRVYEKLGFRLRKQMLVYVLRKVAG